MRILVTGIDGFVGSHLAEYLATVPGAEVSGTSLAHPPYPNLKPEIPNLRIFQADLTESGRIYELFQDIRPERVIHLAGQAFVPLAIQDPLATMQANVIAGVHILEAARSLREREGIDPGILIVSSGEVYGALEPERQPATEECLLTPGNPYAASKASIDLIAQSYRRTYNMNVVVARPFNHAGPRQNPSFVTADFARRFAGFSLGKGAPPLKVGNLHVRRDFTDVRDVVRAYWRMLELKGDSEAVFNVCSGVGREIADLVTLLQEISGIAVKVERDENRVRINEPPGVIGSSERLRRATGWVPTIPFEKTMRDVYSYWRDVLRHEAGGRPVAS